jgi:hypothetical protein
MKIPLDKQGHFFAGYAIAATAFPITHLGSLAIVAAVATLKEWYDFKHPLVHTADVYDFIATSIGGICAYGFLSLINVYF